VKVRFFREAIRRHFILSFNTSGGISVATTAGIPPPGQPTPVIAGLDRAPARSYLDRQGRFHSALALYVVHTTGSPARRVGQPDPTTASRHPMNRGATLMCWRRRTI